MFETGAVAFNPKAELQARLPVQHSPFCIFSLLHTFIARCPTINRTRDYFKTSAIVIVRLTITTPYVVTCNKKSNSLGSSQDVCLFVGAEFILLCCCPHMWEHLSFQNNVQLWSISAHWQTVIMKCVLLSSLWSEVIKLRSSLQRHHRWRR